MKVLGIGAHPDDIEIFMYGLLSIFKKEGHQVIQWLLLMVQKEVLLQVKN